jgi:hypothetical protein
VEEIIIQVPAQNSPKYSGFDVFPRPHSGKLCSRVVAGFRTSIHLTFEPQNSSINNAGLTSFQKKHENFDGQLFQETKRRLRQGHSVVPELRVSHHLTFEPKNSPKRLGLNVFPGHVLENFNALKDVKTTDVQTQDVKMEDVKEKDV